ncbi:LysR family transcriptional regulator [Streptomyces parvus]|uniref:LysR family transcriptional regulator n=1 Tax=Streptomyces sp. JL1001 TaxID=3078227 RepID=A0AAU8KEJ4_9ACTN|nr:MULTISPECIES: LysR family transcriptional regulator [unclassified Streptomyces]PJN34158.1 LysR family transcriptional regulator [Streptomyces sp. CB02613]SCD57085.1 DNA-binding transcriptional regulator, LysR family [Streptomyces sp. Termitarium-T10T-6]
MDVELRHARLVVAIATARSISKAAARLDLPQPALSSQLRRIERELGGEIFARSHLGVVPTPLGERLLPMFVDLARSGDALLAEASTATMDTLLVGNVEWTPPALREAITASLPTVDIQTETVDPADAMEALREGRLNLALVPKVLTEPVNKAGQVPLSTAVVVNEPVWLALPVDHPISGPDPVDPTQVGSLDWVRYARGHWFQGVEEEAFADLVGDTPTSAHRVGGHHEAMSWVRDAGMAALTTPTGATKDVQLVPVAHAHTCELLLVWRSEAISRTVLEKLLESVRRYYCVYANSIPHYWSWMAAHPEQFREVEQYLPRGPRSSVAQ